jgi:pimeloyl-ACP methyl ester carboxylesterase
MSSIAHHTQRVRANGIEIHYVEAGAGEPLVVLNNGMISTHPIWRSWISSYAGYLAQLAEHFRVIAPDFRGSGRTVHPGGPISYDLLAEDVLALIDALELRPPTICGYGEGGLIASIVAIRKPSAVRAIVNHHGYDLDPNPSGPTRTLTRQMLGGRPDATSADPAGVERSPMLGSMVTMMKADHDAAQGAGHWKTVLERTFDRVSNPSGYTFESLRAITAPMLVLLGDRDAFCTVEDGVRAYRALPNGELAVQPGARGGINPASVAMTIEFLERRLESTG